MAFNKCSFRKHKPKAVNMYNVFGGSKQPPVKTGGIAVFRLCLSAFGGYFHPPIKIGGIEIGRINVIEGAVR
jgi:hypothetical protein